MQHNDKQLDAKIERSQVPTAKRNLEIAPRVAYRVGHLGNTPFYSSQFCYFTMSEDPIGVTSGNN